MVPLTEERQNRLTELLLAEKRRLWEEVRRELFDNIGEELHGQYDLPQDTGDQGLIDLLSETGLALADIRRQQLTQLDEALARLRHGQYGICEDCGEPIDEKRLQVSPYAACCVPCQSRREGPASGPGRTL